MMTKILFGFLLLALVACGGTTQSPETTMSTLICCYTEDNDGPICNSFVVDGRPCPPAPGGEWQISYNVDQASAVGSATFTNTTTPPATPLGTMPNSVCAITMYGSNYVASCFSNIRATSPSGTPKEVGSATLDFSTPTSVVEVLSCDALNRCTQVGASNQTVQTQQLQAVPVNPPPPPATPALDGGHALGLGAVMLGAGWWAMRNRLPAVLRSA